jgi:3-methyladenine DNA glycosylase AlkD
MKIQEVMNYLESKGSEQTRSIYTKHGAPEGFYGVKVADLKPLIKKLKGNHELALELYNTGNSDAQYLAGIIAVPSEFSKKGLEDWALAAGWYMISEYAVAWNVAERPDCIEITKEWIDSGNEKLMEAGWAAMNCHFGFAPNEELDLKYHESLIGRIEKEIQDAPNRVRYCMNGYVIALGGAVQELTETCKSAGDRIGKVEVSMGETACKVPVIRPYIENMESRGRIGKKKKTLKY